MSEPRIGARARVQVDLATPEQGGRTRPVASGYRPLCFVAGPNGTVATIGLCKLELEGELAPGKSAPGTISFDESVSGDVRSLVKVGSNISLAEGNHIIGSARVLDVI